MRFSTTGWTFVTSGGDGWLRSVFLYTLYSVIVVLLLSLSPQDGSWNGSVGSGLGVICFSHRLLRQCNHSGSWWHFPCCVCVQAEFVDLTGEKFWIKMRSFSYVLTYDGVCPS